MSTKSSEPTRVYTIRMEGSKLDRLAEIAAGEHRTLASKLRVMVDEAIADAELEQKAA